MLPLRFPVHWRIASALLLAAVLLAAMMPAMLWWSNPEKMARWFGSIDKWKHVGTFAVLALWFAGQYRPNSYWRIAIGLLAFGLLIELCQRMVSYRTAEWLDVAADLLGIAIGLLIARAGLGGWAQQFESWLGSRA
ncbi:MAG TPA: VanZ family protein [Woeseiaceae bacterium]|nr:VanZ family protein [Woeseiaceae bacterium]